MKKIEFLVFFTTFFLMIGCTSSHITSVWTNTKIQVNPYHKIMVLGVIHETDRSLREDMEEHLAGDLKNLGYNAFSSFIEYGPKAFDQLNEEQTNNKLRQDGVDAVLTVVLLDKKKERYYVPNQIFYSPLGIYNRDFYVYYRIMSNRIITPGYYSVSTRYFWESNFYDLTTNDLIYSAQTQSFDRGSKETLAHEYGKLIIKNMVKKNVLSIQSETIAEIFF